MSQDKNKRTEPTLGDLGHIESTDVGSRTRERHSREPKRKHAPPWVWPLLAVLVAILLALAWVNQDHLRALFPPTQLNVMLDQADRALADGYLEGEPDSAHALYARALEQEPDNNRARSGLRAVGEAELARASSAIRAGDLGEAAAELAYARALLGGGLEVNAVASKLQHAQHPASQLQTTIARAQAAMQREQVAGPDGAAALYHQALQIDPDNQVARHGLNQAGDALASQARIALNNNNPATASSVIKQLDHLLPHDSDLPALRAGLAAVNEARALAASQHLAQGQKALHEGRFSGAGEDNALVQFQAVLATDRDNAEAKAGLQQVARALIVRANAAMDADDAAQAASMLAQAAKLAPKSAELAMAQLRLRTMPGYSATDAVAAVATSVVSAASTNSSDFAVVSTDTESAQIHPKLTPLQQVEVEHLLRRARSAAKAGHVMLPPGQSAYDLYAEVLSIDGNNADARAGMDALAAATVLDFRRALDGHDLERASGYLQAMNSLAPADPKLDSMTTNLANAWLDRAEAELASGQRTQAEQALQAARKLTPNATRVQSLAKRFL